MSRAEPIDLDLNKSELVTVVKLDVRVGGVLAMGDTPSGTKGPRGPAEY